MNGNLIYTAPGIFYTSYYDSGWTGNKYSPELSIRLMTGDGLDLYYSQKIDLSDSTYFIYNSDNIYGLKIKQSGQLQSATVNGNENILTDYGTLSGTVWVTDSSGAKKYMTFTNGLLTASDADGFAGIFGSSPSENLTMTDFKKSPEYTEFLEFQKYLAMKQSFDNNNSTKGN
jgi:hypothetical protein